MEIKYRNQIINVNDKGFFEVKWKESSPEEVKNEYISLDTLQKAKNLIDFSLKILQKKEPLNLSALTSSGTSITITGIHLGTHGILSTPSFDRYRDDRVYLDHPHITSQLARLKAIQEETKSIVDDISVYQIKTSFGYGRMDVEEYEKYIEQLKESYASAQTKIEESSPE